MPKSKLSSRTVFQFALTMAAHALVLLLVVVIPPLVYNAVYFGLDDHPRARAFLLVGGITYPLYAGYWILKAKNFTFKFTSLHLLTLVTFTFFVFDSDLSHEVDYLKPVFPIVWSMLAVPIAAVGYSRGQSFLVRACVVSLLFSFPLALAMSAFVVIAQGLSSALKAIPS